jgi:hypothetical protein
MLLCRAWLLVAIFIANTKVLVESITPQNIRSSNRMVKQDVKMFLNWRRRLQQLSTTDSDFASETVLNEKQVKSNRRKNKKNSAQIGPLIGMISFVIFLRAVLPKYWYEKESNTNSSAQSVVELSSSTNTSNGSEIRSTSAMQIGNNQRKNKEELREDNWKHLCFCIIGIQVCYLAWGTAQERIMAHTYGSSIAGLNGEHFQYSSILLLLNKILSALLAIVLLTATKTSSSSSLNQILFQTAPPLLYSYAALANGIASWCQYEALKYTIFPVVVVFKSSKLIPVMLIGSLRFFNKKYPISDYIVAATIALGVTMALVSGSSINSGDSGDSSSGVNCTGLFLMFGYIIADSFTSNWQSHIFKTYKSSSLHMMFAANSFSTIILTFTVQTLFFFLYLC